MKKALLFINGDSPKTIPDLSGYDLIACTDGAFHYLKKLKFPLDKLDLISGDFDSHKIEEEIIRQAQAHQFEIIETPDQNKTDFHKALEIIIEKSFENIDVYGGSGGEQDHFLGNLSVAFVFKDKANLRFFDQYSSYYFIPKKFTISDVKGKMISLMPFPIAKNIETKGLKWPLYKEDLILGERIGTRNIAENKEVVIKYKKGDLLIFVGN
ncbi:thiamine diphosphokinase [Epilithonimonas hungarica]|uniref:Thiamine diphosphokinase n=1 Tax=Epilithonimonas hungarica TaxID=454006 RepID=A0A1G7V9I4_9FLAO|nr:thiamine diphosphokinase [Epilithonimonas hungarica]MPT32218.1 thiamine diphosphokinase [Chryseobacterium sp.]SDG56456.1 thiamine pyrophosphokinase [Epilithonimonas hungarica]